MLIHRRGNDILLHRTLHSKEFIGRAFGSRRSGSSLQKHSLRLAVKQEAQGLG